MRIEPVGERVLERSGIDTTRSSTSLQTRPLAPTLSVCENYHDAPDCANPSHSLARTLRTKPLDSVGIKQLERAQGLHQAHIRARRLSPTPTRRCLFALHPRGHRADVILRRWVQRRRHRADLDAVQQIECDDASTASRRDPRQQQHVGVQERLASLPPVRRRRMDVEVPQQPDPQRLKKQ